MRNRPLILAVHAAGLLVFGAGCFSTTQADPQAPGETTGKCLTPAEAKGLADQVLQLLNLERAQRSLAPVVHDDRLEAVAEEYACRMAEANFFGHRDPDTGDGPRERAMAGRYRYYAVGENLAAGPQSAPEVMKLWMESPSHRDIILDPTWREVGIGIRTAPDDTTYWVQEFGDPADF